MSTSKKIHSLPAVGVALAESGIKLPSQMQQIWQWLYDNPRKMASDIAATLPIPSTSVSSVIAQLKGRKMINSSKEWSEHAKKEVTYYSAAGKTFELLPDLRVKNKKASGKATVLLEQPEPIEEKKKPEQPTADSLLDTLSVREAYALYIQLRAMFSDNVSDKVG